MIMTLDLDDQVFILSVASIQTLTMLVAMCILISFIFTASSCHPQSVQGNHIASTVIFVGFIPLQ